MDFLKHVWKKWLAIAKPIGNFQSQVILSVFYIILFLPLGVGYRLFADPFLLRKKIKSNFGVWEHSKETIETAKRQY